jgi:hypothetical protein
MQHPGKYSRGEISSKYPTVIMDELRVPLNDVEFGESTIKAPNEPTSISSVLSALKRMKNGNDVTSVPNSRGPNSSAPTPIITSSMLNWDNNEIPDEESINNNSESRIPLETNFKIDDVDMCLCVNSDADDNYYVVL